MKKLQIHTHREEPSGFWLVNKTTNGKTEDKQGSCLRQGAEFCTKQCLYPSPVKVSRSMIGDGHGDGVIVQKPKTQSLAGLLSYRSSESLSLSR